MKKIIKEFLSGNTGTLSSKRLMGCLCVLNSIFMKYVLIVFYSSSESLAKLDGIADSLLIAGVTLISGGLLEKITTTKNDSKL